jgi:hypothetical protein
VVLVTGVTVLALGEGAVFEVAFESNGKAAGKGTEMKPGLVSRVRQLIPDFVTFALRPSI